MWGEWVLSWYFCSNWPRVFKLNIQLHFLTSLYWSSYLFHPHQQYIRVHGLGDYVLKISATKSCSQLSSSTWYITFLWLSRAVSALLWNVQLSLKRNCCNCGRFQVCFHPENMSAAVLELQKDVYIKFAPPGAKKHRNSCKSCEIYNSSCVKCKKRKRRAKQQAAARRASLLETASLNQMWEIPQDIKDQLPRIASSSGESDSAILH